MKDEIRDQRWMFRWALPASVAVHVLIAAFLIFGFPVSFSQSQEEQTVDVQIVPPPEPPEPQEKAEVEPPAPKPEPEKPQEESAEPAPASPLPVLKPVVEFGEKDTGPRESLEGNSPEDGSVSPEVTREPDEQEIEEAPTEQELAAISQIPENGAPTPTPRPAGAIQAQQQAKLQEAKTLFSRAITDDPRAVTAMLNIPRDERASQLCLTELRQQLLNASPPYFPELLPSDRPRDGTVIEIPRVAFRASGRWYELSYRCEVDAGVSRVLSFAYHVGEQIPRSEWQRRGLPAR